MRGIKKDLVARIKHLIIQMIHDYEIHPITNYSYYLGQKLKYDYTYLANIFSQEANSTIEQYIIYQKILLVKKLLANDKHTLTEIAARLHYSSVAHLANQFKKVEGITSSEYKRQIKSKLTMANKPA